LKSFWLWLGLIGVAGACLTPAQASAQAPAGPQFPSGAMPLSPVPPVPPPYGPPAPHAAPAPNGPPAPYPAPAPYGPPAPSGPPPDGAPGPGAVQPPSPEQVFPIPDVERVLAPAPPPAQPKKIWSGSFELGLDGSEGNSETFNIRTGFDAKRKTGHSIFAVDLDYRQETNRGQETANRSYLDWKYERLFRDSPWTAVAHGTVEHDEFQTADLRTTVDLALGYQFIATDDTTLSFRSGAGTAYESGGPDEGWVPQAVFGAEYEHKLNDRYKFAAKSEYTPEMTGWDDFRVRTQASLEALIDAEMNLSMKLSVRNRYDSTPNGADPNDLDYSVVLLWSF